MEAKQNIASSDRSFKVLRNILINAICSSPNPHHLTVVSERNSPDPFFSSTMLASTVRQPQRSRNPPPTSPLVQLRHYDVGMWRNVCSVSVASFFVLFCFITCFLFLFLSCLSLIYCLIPINSCISVNKKSLLCNRHDNARRFIFLLFKS